MKKLFILFAVLWMVASASAATVTPKTAMKAAKAFKALEVRNITTETSFKHLYIFAGDNSFVIVAGDDCVRPILAYSTKNTFSAANMPEQIMSWLQWYDQQIEFAVKNKARANEKVRTQWERLVKGQGLEPELRTAVDPLVQTYWSQEAPFNNLCPGGSKTGCVATAMAQLMKYWNYPATGVGSHSYSHPTYGTLTADFGATTYDWDNMTNSYGESSTAAEQEAVATLMYHCGVALDMDYGTDVSSAAFVKVESALKQYFNYQNTVTYIQREDINNDETWKSTIRAELDAGRPMQYSGRNDANTSGHAMVCDGYDENDMFHINWGWGGMGDGFYSIDDMLATVSIMGMTIPVGEAFNLHQGIVYGIQPDQAAPMHWTPQSGSYEDNMTLTGVIQINDVEQYSLDYEVGAFCGSECRGTVKAILFPSTNRYLVMLTIFGNTGDQITFKLYDHSQGVELNLQSPPAVTFGSDGLGELMNPYVLNFTSSSSPSTYLFVGTVNESWGNPSNWENGSLPGADDEVIINAPCQLDADAQVGSLTIPGDVSLAIIVPKHELSGHQNADQFIPAGTSLTIQENHVLMVENELVNAFDACLVLEPGAQLVNNSANVNATMKTDIASHNGDNSNGWYTIASPFYDMAINGSDFLTPNYDLYYFDASASQEEWQNYKLGGYNLFEPGRGYLYANSNTFEPAFSGTLNHANVTYTLTSGECADPAKSFVLLGNPFPHNIYKGAGGAIDDTHLASGYYTLTNEGAWHVHTFQDPILPGQGILVKTTATTSLTIAKTNAAATAESNAKASRGVLEFQVTGPNGEDRAFAYLCEGIGLDKWENLSDQLPSLSIRNDGKDYAIAHVTDDSEALEVCFSNKQSGTYTLTVKAVDARLSVLQLKDSVTGTTIDLLKQPSYTFQTTGRESESRFTLLFKAE